MNKETKVMLFTITDKKTSEVISTGLTALMVHYLFIDKKWDRNKCVIHKKVGHKMDYETFKNRYPL